MALVIFTIDEPSSIFEVLTPNFQDKIKLQLGIVQGE